jgi:ribose-phosphate pyrophosphokinase
MPSVLYAAKGIRIISSIKSSDELMLLILAIDTIRKDGFKGELEVFIPYFPYAQADRNFGMGESFSLKTITNILNTLHVDKFIVYDVHSDVTSGLLNNCEIIDNSEFVKYVISDINSSNLTLLSPDAGAYKKIGKLADKIQFKGDVAAANKYRNTSSGNIDSLELSKQDFGGADILIVDDIVMGGRTFIGLAEKLRERNVGKIFLAVSHGIFNYGLKDLNPHFDGIYTTNSRINHLEDADFNDKYGGSLYKLKVYNIVK